MKTAARTLLVIYLAALIWLVLFKFSFDLPSLFSQSTRSLNLLPFASLLTGGNGGEVLLNFLVFIPFGVLLSLNFKKAGFAQNLRLIFFFSVAVEVLQYILGIGITDITDVITNTAGGLAGLLLYLEGLRHVRSKRLDQVAILACALLFSFALYGMLSHTVRVRLTPPDDVRVSKVTLKSDQLAWPANVAAAVGTVKDGVLASSNSNENALPTASMAKVIAALAILEKQPLAAGQSGPAYTLTASDVANYSNEAARGGSVIPVYEGMTLTLYEALQAMLIASANNMADSLVQRVFGSQEAYISYAQDMLGRMGLAHTRVADASGFSPDTASTPSDLVSIGVAALKNPVIADIVSQPQAWVVGVGTIKNTNELLRTDGIVGIKTGTTDTAGKCLLFAASYTGADGKKGTIVGVIMGEPTTERLFADSKKLLESTKRALSGYGDSSSDHPTTDMSAPPR